MRGQAGMGKGLRLKIDFHSAPQLIADHKGTTVARNLDKLLAFLGTRTKHPSDPVVIESEADFTVIDTDKPEDLEVYLRWLENEGLIEREALQLLTKATLTQRGWVRIQPGQIPGGTPGTCFVAMSFDESMDEAYDVGIKPAIESDCGLKAIRMDRTEHNNEITDEMMAAIRSAEFTVADFTEHSRGVYYEAGFARGLGRQVIYCCRKDSFEDRHFDTSVISHVVWDDTPDLRKKLGDRIKATILPKA
jgi:hypothetical protein